MTLATNSAVGDIHLAGDLAGSTDPYNPELTPTGVVPGAYTGINNIVVNAKGQILYIEQSTVGSLVDATTTNKGVVQLDEPFFIGGAGKTSLPEATDTTLGVAQAGNGISVSSGVFSINTNEILADGDTTYGVVRSADTNNIVISSGEIDVGPNVLVDGDITKLSTRVKYGNTPDLEEVVGTPNGFAPDLSKSNIFVDSARLTDQTILPPINAIPGDRFCIIVDGHTEDVFFDSAYKLRGIRTVDTTSQTTVISCLYLSSSEILTLRQGEFSNEFVGKQIQLPVNFSNNAYLQSNNIVGLADGKQATISCWFRSEGTLGTFRPIFDARSGGYRLTLQIDSNNNMQIIGRNDVATTILNCKSNITISNNTWYHVIVSFDLAAGNVYMYINDQDVSDVITNTNDDIDFAGNHVYFIAASGSPSNFFTGQLADFWFDTTYLDITNESNRRKFIRSDGYPQDLGVFGDLAIGTQPLVYFRQKRTLQISNSDFESWNTGSNYGTGDVFLSYGSEPILPTIAHSPIKV